MTTLKIEVNEEKDLSILTKILADMGLSFSLESSQWVDVPELTGVNAGLKDLAEGKIYTHEEASSRIAKKLKELSGKYGS